MSRFSQLLGLLLLAGCATTQPDQYPSIEAHHPDGSGGAVLPHKDALNGADGYVITFAAGDEIDVQFTFDSTIARLEAPATIRIVLKEPIRVAIGPLGVLVSRDGGTWQSVGSAFSGSIESGLSITREDPVNRATISATLTER